MRSEVAGVRDSAGCAHCGLPVVEGAFEEGGKAFCCAGCRTVYGALHEAGLGDYYRLREALPEGPAAEGEGGGGLADFEDPEVARRWCRRVDAPEGRPGAWIATLALEGLHCASCVWVVEDLLLREPGVVSARVSLAEERVRVVVEAGAGQAPPLVRMARALHRFGYRARPMREGAGDERAAATRAARGELSRLGVAAACSMNLMLMATSLYGGDRYGMAPSDRALFQWVSLALATPVVAYSAAPILVRGAGAVARRVVHVDVPLAFAIAAMYAVSAWATVTGSGEVWFDSLGMLVFLLLSGRYLESNLRRRVGRRLQALLRRSEPLARRLRPGVGAETVPSEALVAGDRLALSPGDVVPVDVVVEDGESEVDLAVVDGESHPVVCGRGAALPAGARVVTGALRARVEREAAESTLARLRARVADILSRRTEVERLADRIARVFVAATLVVASGTAAAWAVVDPSRAVGVTVAVLVVACPCALALATPLAFAAAVHGAAARGVLVRDGGVLLALGRVRHVAFDKTGTLTDGRLRPGPLHLAEAGRCLGADAVLRLAAAACAPSRHPVSRAVVEAAEALPPPRRPLLATGFRETAGIGVEARVDGRSIAVRRPGATVWVDGVEAGRLDVRDLPRPGAKDAVRTLVDLGIGVSLLSGDGEGPARALGEALGIPDVRAGLTPQDKADALAELRRGGPVAFVGDGLNDGPALAAADVSLAVDAGVDLAVEAASGTLSARRPGALVEAVRLGRDLDRTLRRNFQLSATYNVLGVVAAAAGLVSPLIAAALMPGSSLAVVLNSARLARPGRR